MQFFNLLVVVVVVFFFQLAQILYFLLELFDHRSDLSELMCLSFLRRINFFHSNSEVQKLKSVRPMINQFQREIQHII